MNNALRLSRLRGIRDELDRYAIFAATAVFTLVAVANGTGEVDVPGGTPALCLFPALLLTIDWLKPDLVVRAELRGAAAVSVLVLVALALTPTLTATPIYAVGLPLVIVAGLVATRFPAAATLAATLLAAVIGSFQAFLGFSPSTLIDLLLASIWFAVLIRVVVGRPYSFVAWPAILGCTVFIGLTLIDLVTSENFSIAFIGVRTTIWYMVAFLVVAYAGWRRETYRRIALGMVAITALVTTYTALRWAIGPSGAERELASVTANAINVDPIDKSLRVVGSFQTAHQMAFWAAFMGPFCLGVALWARGRWRAAALGAVVLSLLAIAASEVRGPAPGFVAGVLLVLALHQLSRAFPAFKANVAALAVIATLGLGGAVVLLASSESERVDRFERILDPETDPTFIQRQLKWEAVLSTLEDNPFGRGLGTAGAAQVTSGDTIELAEFNIDNSYLKIAYEQGLVVMILFIFVMLSLLVSMSIAAARTPSREAAAFGMGACGALVSMLISFYSAQYIESATIVSAWLVVGVGLSFLVSRQERLSPTAEASSIRHRFGGPGSCAQRFDALAMIEGPDKQDAELAVIIPTKDRRALLLETLTRLREHSPGASLEVIVVDDGSEDDTVERAHSFATPPMWTLTVLRRGSEGPAAARNAGVRETRAPTCLFMGDDSFPTAGFLEGHLRFHREHREHEWAMLGLVRPAPPLDASELQLWLHDEGSQFGYGRLTPETEVDPSCFWTSNVSVKRSLFQSAGGFDETFPEAACEDAELGMRLARHGMRLIYDASSIALHFHPTDLGRTLGRMQTIGTSYRLLVARAPEIEAPRKPGMRHRVKALGLEVAMRVAPARAVRQAAWRFMCDEVLREAYWEDPGPPDAPRIGRRLARITLAERHAFPAVEGA